MNIKTWDPFTGRDIQIAGIVVGGGWRTGCGSHPLSAERVEELEESAWSVVGQKNVYRAMEGPALMYGAETLKKAQENKWEVTEM